MKGNLLIIVFSVLVILMVSIQGFNEGRITKKQTRIEILENHIEELYEQEAERIMQDQERKLYLTPPMRGYRVTSECGIRTDPMGGGVERLHEGMDIVGEEEIEILAAAPGTVIDHWLKPGWKNGILYKGHPVLGAMIVIDHGGGVYTKYGHMAETFVKTGQQVKRGQVIGIQGSTGMSIGDHLHFEIIYDPEVALTKGIYRKIE